MSIQREWAVARGVKFFCKRCIAVQHEFAAHDRGRSRSALEHIGEANRGLRAGWPDIELVLAGGRTFRCELKAPGVRLEEGGRQQALLKRLNDLGHPAAWANSVRGYAEACLEHAVPLTENWATVAALADELVAGDIRRQETRRPSTKRPVVHSPTAKVRRYRQAGVLV